MTELHVVGNQIPATTPAPGNCELAENKLAAREVTPHLEPRLSKRKGGWIRKVERARRAETDYRDALAYLVEACEALLSRELRPIDHRIIARELQAIREKLEGDNSRGH